MRPELTQAARLLKSKDPQDIEKAVRILQNTVYSFSMKVCGHREDAEDTMQEVLFRSLPHLSKLEEPRALAVWLYTVTRNRCWRMRRKSVYAPKQTLSLDELMPNAAELERLLTGTTKNPEVALLHQEQDEKLREAVLQIPPHYRIILVLHDMEDLDTEQTAQVLGLKTGTVRVRLHRARLLVRKLLSVSTQDRATIHEESRKRKKPQECRELFAQLSEFIDGRLETLSCKELQKHIADCPACVVFLADLQAAISRCRNLGVKCDPEMEGRLSTLLLKEYLRLIGNETSQRIATVPN